MVGNVEASEAVAGKVSEVLVTVRCTTLEKIFALGPKELCFDVVEDEGLPERPETCTTRSRE